MSIRPLLSVSLALVLLACGGERRFSPGDSPDGQGGAGGETSAATGGSSSGGSVGAGGGEDAGGESGAPRVEAATVGDASLIESSPTGVAELARIVVTFDAQMDQLATEDAYTSESAPLAPDAVTFSWNSAGTVLTITPDDPLPYTIADSPSVPAAVVGFTISTDARSDDGVALEEELVASFSPFRRVTQTIEMTAASTGSFTQTCPSPLTFAHSASAAFAWVAGCWNGPPGPGSTMQFGPTRAFLHFGLESVPGEIELESAGLELAATGSGWSAVGNGAVAQVDYGLGALASRSVAAGHVFAGGATGHLGNLSPNLSSASPSHTYDVKAAVESILAERADNPVEDYVQFRVQPTAVSGQASGSIALGTRRLVLVYLAH